MRQLALTLERVTRIELVSQPWEGRILPLNHTRAYSVDILSKKRPLFEVSFGDLVSFDELQDARDEAEIFFSFELSSLLF